MPNLLTWLQENALTILISAILPLWLAYLQRRKMVSESLKVDAEARKVDAEADSVLVGSTGHIINFWEEAVKSLEIKAENLQKSNTILDDKVSKLQTTVFTLQSKQRVLLNFVSKVLNIIKETRTDALAILDHERKISYISPNIYDMTGFTPAEIIGTNRLNAVHPDDIEKAKAVYSHVLEFPELPIQETFRSLHKKGFYIWLELTYLNLLENPNVKGILVSFRDVTNIREAEEEFRLRYAEILE